MRIIDPCTILAALIILTGIPALVYLKFNTQSSRIINIIIEGRPLQSSLLSYHIERELIKHSHLFTSAKPIVNITIIAKEQNITSDKQQKRNELDKNMLTFCGVQGQFMKFLQRTSLKYKIKEYGVYYGTMNQDNHEFKIEAIESKTSSYDMSSISQYGLSHQAASQFFLSFAKQINASKSDSKRVSATKDISASSATSNYLNNFLFENGLSFFETQLGLDHPYIQKYIKPIIRSNYLQQPPSTCSFFKLLPVYCHRRTQLGKSLVLFQNQQTIKSAALKYIKNINVNFLKNYEIEYYEIKKIEGKKQINVILNQISSSSKYFKEEEEQSHQYNQTLRKYLNTTLLFLFQEPQPTVSKYKYFYKTIIDGKIKNDEVLQQIYTIYIKKSSRAKKNNVDNMKKQKSQENPIYSITRICSQNCKNYQNSVYILISKNKITSTKQLQMFQQHQIIYYRKFWVPKYMMPSPKRMEESHNVFKIYELDTISDSYQARLRILKQLAKKAVTRIKKEIG